MPARIAEVFADRATGEWRDELHGGGFGRTGGDHDGVVHGSVFTEDVHDGGDGGHFLTGRHVDAEDAAVLLVENGVHGDGGFPGLAVSDDEFALAAADRDHGVDTFDAGLEWFFDRLSFDDVGGGDFDRQEIFGIDAAFSRRWADRWR